jgi:hypothetical protein
MQVARHCNDLIVVHYMLLTSFRFVCNIWLIQNPDIPLVLYIAYNWLVENAWLKFLNFSWH